MSSEDKESYSELSCSCCDQDSEEEHKNYQSRDLMVIYSGFKGINIISIIK